MIEVQPGYELALRSRREEELDMGDAVRRRCAEIFVRHLCEIDRLAQHADDLQKRSQKRLEIIATKKHGRVFGRLDTVTPANPRIGRRGNRAFEMDVELRLWKPADPLAGDVHGLYERR